TGLSPAICIGQEPPRTNPRSTVGSSTEIHDCLRALFMREGSVHCPRCGELCEAHSVAEIVQRISAIPEGTRLLLAAPRGRLQGEALAAELDSLRAQGFVRALVEGEPRSLDEIWTRGSKPLRLDVVVDRLRIRPGSRSRLRDSVELALPLGHGVLLVQPEGAEAWTLADRHLCAEHGLILEKKTAGLFSFNTREGACARCAGLGLEIRFDLERIVPDPELSLRDGALAPWGAPGLARHEARMRELEGVGWVSLDTPFGALPERTRRWLLEGRRSGPKAKRFEGALPHLERRREELRERRERGAGAERALLLDLERELSAFMAPSSCEACGGARWSEAARSVRWGGASIAELSALPIRELRAHAEARLAGGLDEASAALGAELLGRLELVDDVGLGYLSLDRASPTLSFGEAQRLRLATGLGAGLSGVLYVLDEPSAGLHPAEVEQLLGTIRGLRDRGNAVVVVDHDPALIRGADHIVEMGPGAGSEGGRVIAEGTAKELEGMEGSATGDFLSGRRRLFAPQRRREARGELRVRGASRNNLVDLDVEIPIGVLCCVTGPSGAGKSTLVMQTLREATRLALSARPGAEERDRVRLPHGRVEGLAEITALREIDQSALGRSPRSNAATYLGILDELRAIFASLPEARTRGWSARRFSFNVKGGRCESCRGEGSVRVQMLLLADALIPCPECGGRRYDLDTLEVKYRGASIADVLQMKVAAAAEWLRPFPSLAAKLDALLRVGLGYLELGRSATTLSGGEAQRLRIAKELVGGRGQGVLYLLDEPTTGLHFLDVERLLVVLHDLVDRGASIVAIEHDPAFLAAADHILELGPGAGDAGGRRVAEGSPEELAAGDSLTAPYLRDALRPREPSAS
ncbi:MAG: excinuclease ABC subunit UvrA, partial [Myxococcales bacterium]|nr:excinuclease ABC subunit UvrA [Myxococcales bacterium]